MGNSYSIPVSKSPLLVYRKGKGIIALSPDHIFSPANLKLVFFWHSPRSASVNYFHHFQKFSVILVFPFFYLPYVPIFIVFWKEIQCTYLNASVLTRAAIICEITSEKSCKLVEKLRDINLKIERKKREKKDYC